jgi:hypothetical protein
MNTTQDNSITIIGFTPGRGYHVYVPKSQVAEFRSFLNELSADDRTRYAPISPSGERISEEGSIFTFGSACSQEDVMRLCERFVIRA